MKKIQLLVFGGVALLMAAVACHDDDDVKIPKETLDTNAWIREAMEEVYFWNEKLPNIDDTRESDSEKYFYKLLNKEDKWSWITDDYQALAADYAGVPVTMGYDPSFYVFSGSDQVFMVVNYVYPGSAAAEAGLKRGNIILTINNSEMDTTNYYDLYSGDSYSVQLATATVTGTDNISIGPSGVSLSMTARVTTTDPAIHHEVIDTLGYKIGYLAYTEFVSGTNNAFLTSLDNIFNEFKTAGISDLIVDLRYNPGGDIDAAGHLASEIAPASAVSTKKVLVKMQYNQLYQDFFESDPQYDEQLNFRFSNLPSNIDLDKVYFLTTDGTASASELVITGLDPYMEVVQVGGSTYGKYAGAWVIPDNDNEARAKWAIVPVVMKYANSEGFTDFKKGLFPDFPMNDNLIFAVPFGDTADPMIKRAIEDIAGVAPSAATRAASLLPSRFKHLVPEHKLMNKRRNLFVPAPELSLPQSRD